MAAFKVTLTDADTNYRLLTLVRAIDPNYIDKAGHLSVQADPDNAGNVFVGDSNLSATRYGMQLGRGEGKVYGDGITVKQSLGGTYARGDAAGQEINIEVKR